MLVDDFLTHSASRFPHKAAVVCGDRRTTYGELEEASNRLAQALASKGTRPGDRVAVFLDNTTESAVAVFGILKAGCVFAVINPATKPDKLEFILNDCAASSLIIGSRHLGSHLTALSNVGSLTSIVVCGGAAHPEPAVEHCIDYERDLTAFRSSRPAHRSIDVDLAALIYTSGSTGFPKGVAVSHLNVVSAATSITSYLENVADDVIINVLPLSFDYGLYQLLMSVKVGATLILERSFAYPFQVVERISRERVTGFPGVPTVFALLLQMKDLDPASFDTIRYVTNTAAALEPRYGPGLRRLFRNAKIFSMYGLTECKRVSFLEPAQLERRPTSVGKAMPNVHVAVVDEDGLPVPPGVVGELVVRGSNVMVGYWGRPSETAEVIRPGRFPWERILYTGDLFTMDEDGYLTFVCRKDDIIKSRGEKVSPREVERVIRELDDVHDVVVVGVDDPVLGQAVKAVVALEDGSALSQREILQHCANRLELLMVPREVEIRAVLPRTEAGKVRREDLLRTPDPSPGDGQ